MVRHSLDFINQSPGPAGLVAVPPESAANRTILSTGLISTGLLLDYTDLQFPTQISSDLNSSELWHHC